MGATISNFRGFNDQTLDTASKAITLADPVPGAFRNTSTPPLVAVLLYSKRGSRFLVDQPDSIRTHRHSNLCVLA